ncbi:amino acid ABC transporter ATP-binding protein, partial [Thiopseudomonas sp. 4R-3cl]
MTQITPEQPHGAHLPDEAGVRRRRGAAGDDLIV